MVDNGPAPKRKETQKTSSDDLSPAEAGSDAKASTSGDALVETLFAKDAPEDARKAARAQFDAIAKAGRPWTQLPSRLKSAARADAVRLAGADKTAGALQEGGYSPSVARDLARDLGWH